MAPQMVVVEAEESFKGSRKGEVFVLFQPGNDCAPKFKTGGRVLLYLNRSLVGTWEALGCGRIQSLEWAVDDLRFLRALPVSAATNRVAGVVALYEISVSKGFRRVRNLRGIRVHLRSEVSSVEAVTDDEGVYEVYDLAPGNYRIGIDLTKGLKIFFPVIAGGEGPRDRTKDVRATEPVVEIGASTGADVDFVLNFDNQITGRVVDSSGKPMKDVCLQLEPATGEASLHFWVFTCSDADGRYRLADMPPGRYVISAVPWAKGRPHEPTLFYPGTTERKSAQVVGIGNGEHKSGLDFRIPK
ncbi:MAG TPA: carboxypeptidase-like regulatory domain-containing protein [Bryobacteraceae bacterium]|jgi:hypothetical protein